MEKQFKVGDQVRLKKNLKVGKMYGKHGGLTLFDSMYFDGFKEIVNITTHFDLVFIELKCQYNTFDFTPEMLTKRK